MILTYNENEIFVDTKLNESDLKVFELPLGSYESVDNIITSLSYTAVTIDDCRLKTTF